VKRGRLIGRSWLNLTPPRSLLEIGDFRKSLKKSRKYFIDKNNKKVLKSTQIIQFHSEGMNVTIQPIIIIRGIIRPNLIAGLIGVV
jgi:Na+/H+-translocating membrane pyrophosphatase